MHTATPRPTGGGGGLAEGACRTAIGRRSKPTGARRTVRRLERMAALCCLAYGDPSEAHGKKVAGERPDPAAATVTMATILRRPGAGDRFSLRNPYIFVYITCSHILIQKYNYFVIFLSESVFGHAMAVTDGPDPPGVRLDDVTLPGTTDGPGEFQPFATVPPGVHSARRGDAPVRPEP
jgi:hypothetical protein